MTAPSIRVRGVTKYFGDFAALRRVDLELDQGRALALVGRNGAGKTTLLRILAGLSAPSAGEVSFPALMSAGRSSPSGTGVVGHGAWIYDELTGEENLHFFGALYGLPDPRRTAAAWLERVGLARFGRTRADQYSRGMRQRLTLARAFLHDPSILLLDEPWTALDDRAGELLSSLIREARGLGRTIVICSHQLREALDVADEVALLDRGRIAHRGPNEESLRQRPESLYARIP